MTSLRSFVLSWVALVASFVVGGQLKLPPLPDPNCEGRSDCRCGYIGVYKR